MGARGSRAWGPCDGHGKGAWGGGGGGESGEGGAGEHALSPFQGGPRGHGKCMEGEGVWVVAAM